MNVIETALRSSRFFFTHNQPDANKQIACIDAALVTLSELEAATNAHAAAAALNEATLNIAKHEIDFLRRRESAADQAMLETMPDYDAAHEPLANAVMRAKQRIADLERRLGEASNDSALYRAGWLAACGFIDSHVADPDITAEMCKRYAEFNKQRGAIFFKEKTLP